MSSGLSWPRPSWVKLASIRGFPGVPGPHLGRSPGPHRIATSLQDDVKNMSFRDQVTYIKSFPQACLAHI